MKKHHNINNNIPRANINIIINVIDGVASKAIYYY